MPRKLTRFRIPIIVSNLGSESGGDFAPPGQSWRALFRDRAHEETNRPTERNMSDETHATANIKLVCRWHRGWAALIDESKTVAITRRDSEPAVTLAVKSVTMERDNIEQPFAVIVCERSATPVPAEGLKI